MPPETGQAAKSPMTKIEKQRAKLEQHRARLRELETVESAKERKLETRVKILLGGSVMAHMKHDPTFRQEVDAILSHVVKKPADFELLQKFGFLANLPTPAEPAKQG